MTRSQGKDANVATFFHSWQGQELGSHQLRTLGKKKQPIKSENDTRFYNFNMQKLFTSKDTLITQINFRVFRLEDYQPHIVCNMQ